MERRRIFFSIRVFEWKSEAEKWYGNDDGEFTNERHTREGLWTRRILISKRVAGNGGERIGSGEDEGEGERKGGQAEQVEASESR